MFLENFTNYKFELLLLLFWTQHDINRNCLKFQEPEGESELDTVPFTCVWCMSKFSDKVFLQTKTVVNQVTTTA